MSTTPVPPLGSVPRDDHQRHGPNTDGTGRWSGGRVLVLNATYEPLHFTNARRAVTLLLAGKAEAVEASPRVIRSPSRSSSGCRTG